MKTMMTVILTLLVATSAFAQLENSLGIFFDEDVYNPSTTNLDVAPGTELEAYVVLINTTLIYVAAYEVGLEIDGDIFVLGLGGPDSNWEGGEYVYPDGFSYGGLNFGDNLNQIVGFQYPLPTYGVAAVLGKMRILNTDAGTVEMRMGPANPSSVGGAGPAVLNGLDLDDILVCTYTSGPDMGGLVATLNGAGIQFPVATEAHSFSDVKALFD